MMNSYVSRHALSTALTVLTAALASCYYSYSQENWMVLAAFFVTQTTRGTPLRQGLIYFASILAAMVFSSLMLMYVPPIINNIIVATVFIVSAFFVYASNTSQGKNFLQIMLFAILLMIATLIPPISTHFMQDRVMDAAIGGIIGMLCSLFVLPVRPYVEFRKGLVPVLKSLVEFSDAVTTCFVDHGKNVNELSQKKNLVELALQSEQGIYPEWVYEFGFNPGLRAGFRFILISIEQVIEIFFSMDYLAKRSDDAPITESLAKIISECMQKNVELLNILIKYFDGGILMDTSANFTSDIPELEQSLREVVPDNLEMLDVSSGSATLIAFVRDIKDMRGLLLQLVMSVASTK